MDRLVYLKLVWTVAVILGLAGCGGGGGGDNPPPAPTYTVGGVVTGSSEALILRLNGASDLTVPPGGFTFSTALSSGSSYTVTIVRQSASQNCTVNGGAGTIASASVTNVNVVCTDKTYTIAGTLSGLVGSVVLRNNGADNLSLSANGVFTFATRVSHGVGYNVTVATQPAGQVCTVASASAVATANVTNVIVTCANNPSNARTIGGTVSGLSGTVILRNNGGNDLPLSANGEFTFGATVASGTAYAVTVFAQPATQTCVVSQGSGTATANITNVAVACTNNPSTTRTIGGTVSGLTGTVVVQNNGGDSTTISTNGAFAFGTVVANGGPYNVTVLTQPAGQTCTVANGSGTATANVTNVAVTCTTATAIPRTIGGTVSGLTGTVVLQNNGGNNLAVSANGGFTFAATVANGAAYNVTVLTQPSGQTCTVSSGSGTATSNVTNVSVACSAVSRTVGGMVTGLVGTVVLQNNGGNNLSLSANGGFTFSATVANGAPYNVAVLTQPATQMCTVSNGSGTASANVTNVAVTCTTRTYTISGMVSGLIGTIVLQNNGGNNLSTSADGGFTFGAAVNHGAAYNVTVLTQPAGQTCTVATGSGTATGNVTNVAVTCTTRTYTISGNLTGIAGTVALQNNGGNILTLSANGAFTFSAAVAHGSAYSVTVVTQPSEQTCSVSNGSGTAMANVSNVAVSCVYPQLSATGKSLVVTTANFVATFAGADLVGLRNRLTGETYLKNPSAGELASVNTTQGTGEALQTSDWSVAPQGGTGLLVASITVNDSVRTLTMKINIDAATEEIVVKTAAGASRQGLRDASWSMAGLDFTGGRLIVPSFSGEVFDAAHPPMGTYIQYPQTWHAQMFVYEAAAGSFVAYSTDPQFRFKDLRTSSRGQSTADIAIVTEAQAPFSTATAVPEIEWRLKAFAGNWRTAAQVYKSWLAVNRTPIERPSLSWVPNIRNVVTMHPLEEPLLAPLAQLLDPAKTLVYVADWRAFAYDVQYPDYTPRSSPSVVSFIQSAHAKGFKVMLHFDLIGVSPNNAAYPSVSAAHVRNPDNLAQTGWLWDCPSCPQRFAFINPASSAFRSLLIQNIAAAVNAVQPDALHLDLSGPMYHDGNGLIEGMNYPQGSARLHQDLVAAFPNLALGGEGENDVIYGYHQFAQAWFYGNDAAYGHPIVNFLFSPQVQFYGHLGQPMATDSSFKTNLSDLEHRSVTPTLTIYSASDLDMNARDNVRLIDLLKAWQDDAFKPDWNNPNWNGALVRYTGNAGRTATLTDTGTVETLTAGGTTLYELGHGSSRLDSTSYIPNWPAFDNATLYGLDAAKKYWLDLVARPATTHTTSLPLGIKLGADTFVTPRFGLFELAGSGASTAFDFENLFTATVGVRYLGNEYPLGFGATVVPGVTMTVGGVPRRSLYFQTPWQGQYGGETFAEYSVPVAADGQLRFSVGVPEDQTCNDDGVTFRVSVNDLELYSQNYPKGGPWHDGVVSLAPYAGQTVRLRLTSHPGPLNSPACDSNAWSQLAIVYPSATPPTISLPLTLDSTGTFAGFVGDGASAFSSGTVSNLPVPGRFVVFTQPGAAIANGTNLLSLAPAVEAWSGLRGEMLTKGGVFGAGTISSATIGAVTRNPAINAHPPNDGKVVFSWTLRVPDAPTSMSLGWAAALVTNASADGADFAVLINGVQYWRVTRTFGAWITSSIELQQWRGQTILVQFVTDSRANNNTDASYWADLITNTSSVTCSYSLAAPQVTVGAVGAQLTLNVTATAACPWAATSTVPWATIVSNGSSTGNGTVTYAVAQNPSAPRTGTFVIGGQTFTIKQADSNGVFPP